LAWTISFDPGAEKDFLRLDKSIQRKIARYLRDRAAVADDPEALGKPLTGNLSGLRRYRVEDYRVVCRVQKETIVILVLAIGHRRDIYERLS